MKKKGNVLIEMKWAESICDEQRESHEKCEKESIYYVQTNLPQFSTPTSKMPASAEVSSFVSHVNTHFHGANAMIQSFFKSKSQLQQNIQQNIFWLLDEMLISIVSLEQPSICDSSKLHIWKEKNKYSLEHLDELLLV